MHNLKKFVIDKIYYWHRINGCTQCYYYNNKNDSYIVRRLRGIGYKKYISVSNITNSTNSTNITNITTDNRNALLIEFTDDGISLNYMLGEIDMHMVIWTGKDISCVIGFYTVFVDLTTGTIEFEYCI